MTEALWLGVSGNEKREKETVEEREGGKDV